MDFISGEKFQIMCDHFLGTLEHLNYNPNMINYKEKWLDILTLNNEFNNKSLIFCYSDLTMDSNIDLIDKLKLFMNPFFLVLHNSDVSFDEKWLNEALNIKNLVKIYTENMNVLHDNVIPIPIGIANSMWPHGNITIWSNVLEKYESEHITKYNMYKDKFFYFCFNVNTNETKRIECRDKIIDKGLDFFEPVEFNTYCYDLPRYRYAICPDGNGIDTHRLWECLYLKVVPVCKRSILVEYFSEYFPIIILNDWSELNVNNLINNYDKYNVWHNYEKLNFNYYYNMIMTDIIKSYSHYDYQEENFIQNFIGFLIRDGFFIELGANNDLIPSNSVF